MFSKCWTIPLTPSNSKVIVELSCFYLSNLKIFNHLLCVRLGWWCLDVSVLFHVSSSLKQILINHTEKAKCWTFVCVCVSVCCSRNIHHRLPRMDGLWEQHCSLVLEQSLSCCKWTTRICRLCQKVQPSWDQCLRWYICGAYGEASLSWI